MNHQPDVASKLRSAGEAFAEREMELPASKRVKLESMDDVFDSNGQADESKLSPRKSRKPAHPLHVAPHTEHLPGSPQSRFVFDMEKGSVHKPSLIQRLVNHAVVHQPILDSQTSGKADAEQAGYHIKSEEVDTEAAQHNPCGAPESSSSPTRQPEPGHNEFAALHNVADAALALLGEENEPADLRNVFQSLQSGEENLAALIAASEGLLSMKGLTSEPASEQEDEEQANDDVAAYPAPRPPRQPRQLWTWSYIDQGEFAEPLPTWGCRASRTTEIRVDSSFKHGTDEYNKEKDAKIRRQENALKDRDRNIAKLTLQFKSERKQREKRIAELEQEVKKQQQVEKQQEEDLLNLKAEVNVRKDEARQQQSQIKLLKQELAQVHRRQSDAAAAASDVQEELQKLQGEANAANSYKQEMVKYQAEAAKHLKEAERLTGEVRLLRRNKQSQTKERDALLLKLTEMAEQVRMFASLKDRACKMERIVTEITRRSDELRTSSKEADMDAFHTLRDIVTESVKLGMTAAEAAATTSNNLLDLVAAEGGKTRTHEETQANELVVAKEEEVQALKTKCRDYAETLSALEQRLEELSKSQALKPGVWKARVPGGQTGEYHTYRMRSNAQVELPEGTLLSVPRSANMQSSSNSLLTKVYEGDLLNFMEVDMSSLSMAELGVATRQLLSMDMSALGASDLSALLKKLGQVDVGAVGREDVRALASKLLNVLGVEDSIALFEFLMHNVTQSGMMGSNKSRTPMKQDMGERAPTDASPKLYNAQLSARRTNMPMPTHPTVTTSNNPSTRRDLNSAPMQTSNSRQMQQHHMSHPSNGMQAGNDSRRDHDRETYSQRNVMSRQQTAASRALTSNDLPAQLAAQAMIGSSPMQFSSAMLQAASSQPMSVPTAPKNVLRRAPPSGVAIATNPGTLTHAQIASLVGGGSPNVLSIPINQLNQLTQLGGMPVIVPGLGQLVHMPPNAVVQKPR